MGGERFWRKEGFNNTGRFWRRGGFSSRGSSNSGGFWRRGEISAAEGSAITQGSGEREGSAAVYLEGSVEGVSSLAGNDCYCGRESCTRGGLMCFVRLCRISSLLSESSSSGGSDVSFGGGDVSLGGGDASSGEVVRSPEQGQRWTGQSGILVVMLVCYTSSLIW